MTQPSDDRIPVPMNGHQRNATPAPAGPDPADEGPAGPDLRIAVSPAQAAAGFGIIAALILLFVRSRRGRSDRGRGERG